MSELSILLISSLPRAFLELSQTLHISPLALIAVLVVGPCILFSLIIPRNKTHNGHRLPPTIPHLIPFIGSMVTFGINPVKFLKSSYEKFGPVFTFTMWGRKMTCVMGPDGNNFLFNAKLANVSAEEAYRSLTRPVFGEDVVYDVPNSVLMEQKKFIKGGLSLENLRGYVPLIREETIEYVKRWGSSGTVDLAKSIAELTIMTASRCLMGPEIRSKLDESVAQLYLDLDGGFQPINFLFEKLPLPSYWKRDAAHQKMHDIFKAIIEERRAAGNMDNTDVLQHLMNVESYKDGTKFTDKEAANLMIALLMAGQHTSSTTSTWALSYLTCNPQIIDDLIKEQKEIVGDDMNELDFDKLKKMVILDSVIRETLRLRPPIILIMRKVIQDIHFKDYVIPRGHYVCSSPAVSQLDEGMYADAHKFEPQRWVTRDKHMEDIIRKEQEQGLDYGFGIVGGSARSHYLPFGAGRHRCIGEPFAYIQLKTILATIIHEFSLKWPKGRGFPKPDYTTLIAMPEKPVYVEYQRRIAENIVQGLDVKEGN